MSVERRVHRAARPIDDVQICIDCGIDLIDHRNTMTGDPDYVPRYYEEGDHVTKSDGPSGSSTVAYWAPGARRCTAPSA